MSNIGETILSIFHQVSTDFPNRGKLFGVFVIAKSSTDIILWWREYQSSENPSKNKAELILKTSNVQKIMLNYQSKDAYMLINTINPANMHQFFFPPNSSYQLLTFAQTIAITHQMPKVSETKNTLENAIDFISESYTTNKDHYHLFEITVEETNIILPPDFNMNGIPIPYEFVKPDLHIMSQFGIKSEDFIKSPVTLDKLSSMKSLSELKETVKLHGVDPKIRHIIWPLLFNILPFKESKRNEVLTSRVKEYLIIRSQWQTMSKTQLKYFKVVLSAFSTIRVDVKRTHPPDILESIPSWSNILTNILQTFVMWNLDVRYTQGLNDLAVVFMTVFIPSISSNFSADVAESLAFWCFTAFVEKISSGLIAENMMEMQEVELSQIMSIVDKFHPACAKWLRMNGLNDLSFLISSFILAYGRSFSPEAIARLWEALVCVNAPWLFLRYFSASLLIMSFPTLQKIQNCSSGKLVSLMDGIFSKLDIGTAIGVSLSMMSAAHIKEIDEINNDVKNEDVNNIKMKLFEPDEQFQICYTNNGQLFQ
ncbi:TBC domain containing protein [Histomonas meleagridis]|uniref:TBC domain containing protein n=1 Tax=Histomonas meleagridis TaxID=135588 RepID=UPI003559E112|nr:TBC domain containing protein [Histomonas meleagridis]KAH0799244.1 TBC domain containing protein [Histomonas meleagridis]